MIEKRRDVFLLHMILTLVSLVAIYPLVSIFLLALHAPHERVRGLAFPSNPTMESFATAWQLGGFGQALLASAIVATSVVVLGVSFSIFAGFAFAQLHIPFKRVLFAALLIGLVLPYEALIVPLFFGFRELGLVDSWWALILPQVALSVSFGTFWMRTAFEATPLGLIEVAQIDGASPRHILWKILVPMVRPAILTLAALLFLFTWNEFLLALVLIPQNEAVQTAPLSLSFFSGQRRGGDPSTVAAAALIVALPVLVLYIALQRRFVQGLSAGAIRSEVRGARLQQ